MKKIICILMGLFIVSSSFTAMAKGSSDLSAKQLDFLQKLEIIQEVSESDKAYVTRETQALVLMKLLNVDSVEAAAEMGLIDSMDNGQIDLEQYVRFSETARGIVTALGYKPVIDLSSGNYNKYIEIAQSLKISSDLGLGMDDYVSEKDFAVMIYRMLKTPMVSFDPVNKRITEGDDDYNILSVYHDIYTDKGIITSNDVTTLSGVSNLPLRNVLIDNENQFNIGETRANHLVGYHVEYCYRIDEEKGEDVLLWVYADEKNNEIYVESNYIEDYNALVYSYNNGKIIKKAVLDNAVSIIYNGVAAAAGDLSKKQMIPEVGEITLLDNDNNSKYDVVIIMDYSVHTVASVNIDDKTVTYREAGAETLDLDSCKAYDIFDKEYSQKQLRDLRSKAVVWQALSIDKAYAQLLVCTDSIQGSVEAKTVRDGKIILTIEGKEYEVKAVKSADSLSTGSYGTFSFAIDGSIADWVCNIGKDRQFVYIVSAFINEDDDNVYVRVFDGEMKVYPCADNIKIDGAAYTSNAAALDKLRSSEHSIAIADITSAGVLKKIETPSDRNDRSGRPFVVGSVPKQGEGAGTLFKRYFGNLVCNYFGLADDCVVFVIPSDKSDYTRYRLGGPEMVPNDYTIYGLTGYKTSEEQSRCVAAVYDKTISAGSAGASSNVPVAITGVGMVWSNDEIVYNVTGKRLIENADASFMVKDEELLDRIKVGNIIRYDLDDAGYAIAVTKEFDYESQTAPGASNTGGAYGDEYKIRNGKIIEKWDDAVLLDTQGLYNYIVNQYVPLGYCNIWTFEGSVKNPQLKLITESDISVGDEMILWQKWGGVNNILIIKK